MNLQIVCCPLMIAAACGSSVSYGATVTGTVRGSDGATLKGVFVEAKDSKTHITSMVLTDAEGRYRLENLGAGHLARGPSTLCVSIRMEMSGPPVHR